MLYDRITRTQEPRSVFEKADRLSGYGTGEGHHRHPPLRQIQPGEADDPAPIGNWHPTGTDRGDEL